MNLSQLFYLPNEWYAAALGGFAGLLTARLVDWISVSASILGESVIFAALSMIVFATSMAAGNFFVRLRRGRWPVDA